MAVRHELDFRQLKRCSLFGGVTEQAFEIIRPHIRQMHFESGNRIVTEGEVNDRIYFIETGSVEVIKRVSRESDGSEQRLTTMGVGDTFGEMELIDIQPCAASVRTLEPTDTLSLSNRDLYKVSKIDMKTYALLVMNLAREISRRLRQADDMIVGDISSRP
jgi:CRP/FNR family transcriptional regulator, cyclic AMP receptor protein